ncbi:HflC protein [Escherichia coli]|uniref:HflC protein n=1 Tax=Escherichia coli TaxID=562 RepID=A0A376LG43_ECOLX|nr:HflC protein [Escherichia coli]
MCELSRSTCRPKCLKPIYNRMRAEREAVARRHRSQGQEEAEKLRATADYEVTRTLAEAERQGRIMRGEGDAEAAKTVC